MLAKQLHLTVPSPRCVCCACRALAEQPGVGGAEVWARMAMCHRAMGDAGGALHVYQALVQRELEALVAPPVCSMLGHDCHAAARCVAGRTLLFKPAPIPRVGLHLPEAEQWGAGIGW